MSYLKFTSMVFISDFALRKNAAGESFVALILTGGLELLKSQKTGKMYGTVRKTSIPSTLDELTAKAMIGSKLPGEIVRVPCPEYEYTTTTGEKISLDFEYQYVDTSSNVEEKIFG
jgi:hypothetical protein